MKRLLILGITIATFAFILYLAGCGAPATNTNTAVNAPAKPDTPTPTPTPIVLNDACKEPHPDAGRIKQAIVDRIKHDSVLSGHYDPDNTELIKFSINPDDQGFKMKLQGNMGQMALPALLNIMQSFGSDTCVRRVIFVLRSLKLDEKEQSVEPKGFLDSFEWDLSCQDPNHPCNDGSCIPAGQTCTKGGPKGNSNENANANSDRTAGTNTNSNK